MSITDFPPPLVPLSSSRPAVLSCTASGSPLPSIHWYKGDQKLSFSPQQLSSSSSFSNGLGETTSNLILSCQSEKIQVYTCVAVSGDAVEEADTRVIRKNEEEGCVEPYEIQTWSPTVMVLQGEDTFLPCLHQIGSSLMPSRWSFSGEDEVQRISSSMTRSGNLLVSDASWDDMGMYTCRLSNGGTSLSTFLYPLAQE